MKKLVIVGCGRLAGIVSDAVVNGLLPEYDLVGVYSRTAEKAERIVSKMQQHGKSCVACTTPEDLLALKPDYLVEAASPQCCWHVSVPGLFYQTGQTALKKQKEITRVWLLFSYSFNIADSVGKFPLHLFVPAGSANAPYNLSLWYPEYYWLYYRSDGIYSPVPPTCRYA